MATTDTLYRNSSRMPENKYINTPCFQVCVLGWPSVGKSAITHMLVEGKFIQRYTPTVENIYTKDYILNNKSYKLKILDTMGHEENASIRDDHVIGTRGFIVVFDLNHRTTFECVEGILDELTGTLDYNPDDNEHAIILVGNKNDKSDTRAVTHEEAQQLADEYQISHYMECSAKNLTLVDNVFKELLNAMVDHDDHDKKISNNQPEIATLNNRLAKMNVQKDEQAKVIEPVAAVSKSKTPSPKIKHNEKSSRNNSPSKTIEATTVEQPKSIDSSKSNSASNQQVPPDGASECRLM